MPEQYRITAKDDEIASCTCQTHIEAGRGGGRGYGRLLPRARSGGGGAQTHAQTEEGEGGEARGVEHVLNARKFSDHVDVGAAVCVCVRLCVCVCVYTQAGVQGDRSPVTSLRRSACAKTHPSKLLLRLSSLSLPRVYSCVVRVSLWVCNHVRVESS